MEGFCEMFNYFGLRVEVSLQCINGDRNEPTAATLRCETRHTMYNRNSIKGAFGWRYCVSSK